MDKKLKSAKVILAALKIEMRQPHITASAREALYPGPNPAVHAQRSKIPLAA